MRGTCAEIFQKCARHTVQTRRSKSMAGSTTGATTRTTIT
jgi:hypothetical protein